MAKKLFIITGDYSADVHAAAVVRELKKIMPDIIVQAIGNTNLESEGVKLFRTHEKMGKMGVTPKSIIEHFKLGVDIINYLKNEYRPDLVLLIDYGAFNLQISKALKQANIKTFYFIPPQIWASRKHRLKTIKKNIDKVLTIFPFEKEFYEEEGIDSVYVGHPIVSELPKCENREEFFKKHNLDPNKKLIGVFPGSRIFEIKFLLNVFLGAINLVRIAKPDVQFVFSQALSLKDDAFNVPYKKIKGENHQLLAYSDALILASGTVALEAALYNTPMLIAYRGPALFYFIYLLVRNIKRACLVNIITKTDYVDEYLMYDATAEKISKGVIELLDNPKKIANVLKGCQKTKELLGDKNCQEEVAKIIIKEFIGE